MKRSELLQKWKDIQMTRTQRTDGGSGSGNWGHSGRPGHRGGSAGGGGRSNRISLPTGGFTSVQREKRAWDKRFAGAFHADAKHQKDADDLYREQSGKVWQSLSDSQKLALNDYTGEAYEEINTPLRTMGTPDFRTKDITDAIERCPIERDVMLYRNINYEGAEKMLGLPDGTLKKTDPRNLVALEMQEPAFSSTSAYESSGYAVHMEIIAPKGTKGMYVEPFSVYGEGAGLHWDSRCDGKSSQAYFSDEQEVLLQRGTKFRIHDASRKGNTLNLKVIVTGQEYEEIEE